MNGVDLLITIVAVTILVTSLLAMISYVASRLNRARRPAEENDQQGDLRYFVRHIPPAPAPDPGTYSTTG